MAGGFASNFDLSSRVVGSSRVIPDRWDVDKAGEISSLDDLKLFDGWWFRFVRKLLLYGHMLGSWWVRLCPIPGSVSGGADEFCLQRVAVVGGGMEVFVDACFLFSAPSLRSTCHGISAATGKAGAIVGAFGFLYAAQPQDKTKTDAGYPPGIGVKNSLIMLGVINFVGMLFTFLVPEPKGKSLEELSGEAEVEK
ncbi:hypothetical protein F2Q68_00020023 [Brassica cretica]|uniref:Major facilitator superfamily (MFS) profile domain-containing protein n=1 Tax=Brassica cretica TaxID=69181 RepID=A0A8S9FPY6_BRACR|nr:hypothetical protein F2Q68_00020023 [Brassica cretica]